MFLMLCNKLKQYKKQVFIVLFSVLSVGCLFPISALATEKTVEKQGKGFLDFLYFSGYKQTLNYQATGESIFINYVSSIVGAVLGILGVVFFVVVLYGGWRWMNARGNDEQVAEAKKLIVNSTIGLAIVFLAYAIAYLVIYVAGAGLYNTNISGWG